MRSKLYDTDCQIFHWINGKSKQESIFRFMSFFTHAGGATFTIGLTVILCLFTNDLLKYSAFVAAISLLVSHLIVMLVKRSLPRHRPYLEFPGAIVVENPFKDHSFPSGHTTAIFSVTVPFMVEFPLFILPLLILSTLVGISRIVLGLHYPSDVMAGAVIGTIISISSLLFTQFILL
ncbi:phosphatase PAP2 family protein [Bacillus solitudinis]|uniref:phosphatase PAP2 family protein n=1 Tax=Bacillus solitudinis TaxID=2014074 RepID=UPI001D0D02B6|nr:phosphatase PAP2 family protein [Bacillus solitudinis]